MGLSWTQYNLLYYFIQYGLFLVIYVFLVICIPYDLMGWIAETILFLKDDKEYQRKPTCTKENTNKHMNWCSCCGCWISLDDHKDNKNPSDVTKNAVVVTKKDDSQKGWRACCFIQWLFRKRKMKLDSEKKPDPPSWCICSYIWKFFEKFFKPTRICHVCSDRCHVSPDGDCDKCLTNISYCCCECDCGDEDLENKLMPHDYHLNLQKTTASKYCGFIYLNMNRIGIYLLICAFLWCATVVFFEGIILGYATAKSGDSCPTPKRATAATVVDCFIYQNTFDTSPINTSFPTQCNNSMTLSFSGSSASCFAWIYVDVEVIDVIEELGICTGIVALLGSVVAVMSYLCQKHQWRFLFDIVAVLALAAIPVLVFTDGKLPFMTYILLAALSIGIAITEYLMNYVPLLTGLCLANTIFRCIKYRDEQMPLPICATVSPEI